MLALYDKIFGHGNYFCEVQYHGFTSEDYIYPTLAKLAKERGIPLVAANDAHMADNTDSSRFNSKKQKPLQDKDTDFFANSFS